MQGTITASVALALGNRNGILPWGLKAETLDKFTICVLKYKNSVFMCFKKHSFCLKHTDFLQVIL